MNREKADEEKALTTNTDTVVSVGRMLNDLKRYLLAPIFKLDVYPKGVSYCVGLLARLDVPGLPSGYVVVFERCFDSPEQVSEFVVLAEMVARNVLGNLMVNKHFSYKGE